MSGSACIRETFFLQDKFQSIDFPVPVRDCVVVCVVIDLAFSEKIENIIYKNVEDKRPENGALGNTFDNFCP